MSAQAGRSVVRDSNNNNDLRLIIFLFGARVGRYSGMCRRSWRIYRPVFNSAITPLIRSFASLIDLVMS
jgi:hypothetical protein